MTRGASIDQAMDRYAEAAGRFRVYSQEPIDLAFVFGSGLGKAAVFIPRELEIPASELPGWPRPVTAGHPGLIRMGRIHGIRALAFMGRVHSYEGYGFPETAAPAFLARLLGARALISTNAAGGINPMFETGDLMLITDRIILPLARRMGALCPHTEAPDDDEGKKRNFNRRVHEHAQATAVEEGIKLKEGVYGYCSGPSYETPAEIAFLRKIGVDAVGMSTVPELIAAERLGMGAAAISCITNKAVTVPTEVNHASVTDAAAAAAPVLSRLLFNLLKKL